MKEKLQTIIFVFLFIAATSVRAQQNTFSEVVYDSLHATQGYAVARAFDNGFVIAGGNSDEGLVFKIDSAGNFVWSKKIGSNGNEVFNNIIATNDSCFVLAGRIFNSGAGNTDMLIVKITATGDTLWSKEIGGSDNEEAFSVQQANDNGYILAGYVGLTGGPLYSEIYVVKLDSAGNLEWTNVLMGGNSNNYGYAVKQVPDSGYVIIGYIESSSNFLGDACLVKLSPAGVLSWSKKYNLPSPDLSTGIDLEVTANGLVCRLNIADSIVLMKTDFSGNILWSKSYGWEEVGIANAPHSQFHKTSDDCYVFVTANAGDLLGTVDAMLKVDSAGNVVWSQNYFLNPIDAAEAKDKGFLVIGNGPLYGIRLSQTFNPQIGVIKTDSLGSGSICANPFPVSSMTDSLVVTSVLFTSSIVGTLNPIHPVLVTPGLTKDSGCVAIVGGITEYNYDNDISVYPNPTSDKIFIRSNTIINSIALYDVVGNLLIQEKINATSYEMDVSKLYSGIYFLSAGDNIRQAHRKIVKE